MSETKYIAFINLDGVTYVVGESGNMAGAILIGLHNLMAIKRPDLSSMIDCKPNITFTDSKLYTEIPQLKADRK